jgi:hypothetical protein
MRFLLHDVDCLQSCDSKKSVYQGQTINFVAQVKIKVNDDIHDLISLTGDLVDVHPDCSSSQLVNKIHFNWTAFKKSIDISDRIIYDEKQPWLASINTNDLEGEIDVILDTIPSPGTDAFIEIGDEHPYISVPVINLFRTISTLTPEEFDAWQTTITSIDNHIDKSNTAMSLLNKVAGNENFTTICSCNDVCDNQNTNQSPPANTELRQQYVKTRNEFITQTKNLHQIRSGLFKDINSETFDEQMSAMAKIVKKSNPAKECHEFIKMSQKFNLPNSASIIEDNHPDSVTIKKISNELENDRTDLLNILQQPRAISKVSTTSVRSKSSSQSDLIRYIDGSIENMLRVIRDLFLNKIVVQPGQKPDDAYHKLLDSYTHYKDPSQSKH